MNRPTIYRQQSEAAPEIPENQRVLDIAAGQDLNRRKSYIIERTSAQNYIRKRSQEDQKDIKQEKTVDKYKSMEVIYQEANSGHSNTHSPHQGQQKELHYSSFRQERIAEDKKISISYQNDERQTIREMSFQKPLKPMEEVCEVDQIQVEIVTSPRNNDTIDPTSQEKQNKVISLTNLAPYDPTSNSAGGSNQQTPNSKKLMLRIDSIQLAPKLLESELVQPDISTLVGSIKPVNLMRPSEYLQNNTNLFESLVMNSRVNEPVPDAFRTRATNKDDSPPTGYFERKSTGGVLHTIPLHQLKEQLETLAKETLKIIEEVRGKKKATEAVPEIK